MEYVNNNIESQYGHMSVLLERPYKHKFVSLSFRKLKGNKFPVDEGFQTKPILLYQTKYVTVPQDECFPCRLCLTKNNDELSCKKITRKMSSST